MGKNDKVVDFMAKRPIRSFGEGKFFATIEKAVSQENTANVDGKTAQKTAQTLKTVLNRQADR